MFVSTWDEARNYLIPNQIQTVLFGPDFKRSSTSSSDNTKYNLYSLLRTIEDNVSILTCITFINGFISHTHFLFLFL